MPMIIDLYYEPIELDKIGVARRQIAASIQLFFAFGDPVAAHTLACAGAQVVADLLAAKGLMSPFVGGDMVLRERRTEYITHIRAAQNFFKHADRDHADVLTFKRAETEFMLLAACQDLRLLTGLVIPEAAAFELWFFSRHPDVLYDSNYKRSLIKFLEANEGKAIPFSTVPSLIATFRNHIGAAIPLDPKDWEIAKAIYTKRR